MARDVVLITGSTGRIGRHLADSLHAAGHAVRGVDIAEPDIAPPWHFIRRDLRETGALDGMLSDVGCVLHMAGHPNARDWSVLGPLNIEATWRVMIAAADAGVPRLVYASSNHAVGNADADVALTGDMPPMPDSPYGLSKLVGEALLDALCRANPIAGFALRIGAFRPEPATARDLRMWLSPADMTRLALACLACDKRGVHSVWGISRNARRNHDDASWEAIGYVPQDDAESFVPKLCLQGVDVDDGSEWPSLGGAVAATARYP
jgi:uronate dehydrogenase